jgi:hypothetical protein
MNLNHIKQVAEVLGLKLSSLRVYVNYDYFPIIKMSNRVYVSDETLENLKWMKEQGIPITQYKRIENKPYNDGYSKSQWIKNQANSGLGDAAGLDSSQTNVYNVPEYLVLWGGDPSKMKVTDLRKKIKSLLDELNTYETALKEKDKGYTGRTITATAPGLIGELQKTISEQENIIEGYIKKFAKLSKESKR